MNLVKLEIILPSTSTKELAVNIAKVLEGSQYNIVRSVTSSQIKLFVEESMVQNVNSALRSHSDSLGIAGLEVHTLNYGGNVFVLKMRNSGTLSDLDDQRARDLWRN